MAGALISAPTVDLTTGSISLSNVYNHEVFTENSLNFGFNLSFTSDSFADFLQDLDPYGSSSSGFFSNFWTTAPVITAPTVTVGGVEIDTADLNRHFGLRHTITQNVGAGLTQQIQDIQSLLDIRDTLNKQTQIGSL